MATLKIDMCSACSFVIPTMQPAMTAADLFAQWMSSASHNTQASAPFLSTFSQTPPQHYRAGHTLPQSMQPQCTTAAFTQPFAPTPQQQQQQPQLLGHTVPQPTQAPFANSAFTQPPSCHTFNTPHHSTAMPGLQPPPHYNAAIPNPQLSPSQYGSFLTYQPTPHSTSTTLVQPLPATPVSQQSPITTASTPPRSHNKHSRTRSLTTCKKHRSTTRRHSRRKSTKRHHSRHHKSQHQSQRRRQHRSHRRQHPSNTDRSKSNHRSHTGHKPAASSQQHTSPHHHTSPLPPPPTTQLPSLPPPPLPSEHTGKHLFSTSPTPHQQPPPPPPLLPPKVPPPTSLADQIRSIAKSKNIYNTTTSKTVTAGQVHLTPRQQYTPPTPLDTTNTTNEPQPTQAIDHLQEAIERQIQQDPSVLIPWEPPTRDSYQIFKYQELEQRLHSATLQARELTAPSVYFRFLSDRDKSVRDMTAWLETRFPAGIDLPQEDITTTLAKYIVTTGMPINNTLTHITFHQHQQFRMWQLHLQNMPRNTTTSLSQAGNAYYHWAHATNESGWAEQEEVDTHGIVHRPRDRRWCIHSTLAHISSIWILKPDPNFSTPVQHMLEHEDEFGEPQLLPTDVQMRGC